MLDYPAALAVATVIRTGSFDRAAAALHVTPSAISQRVKALEDRLGLVLIARGTPCTATEAGAWLCRHMDHVGMLESELFRHFPQTPDPGQRVTVAIATNADSLGTWLIPALTAFTRETGYLLSVSVDDEDHTADWLRQGRVLAAVTGLAKPVAGCTLRPLGRLAYRVTASPEFAARHFPRGITAEALATAPALTFNQKDRLQHTWAERVTGRPLALRTHFLPSTQGFLDACLGGMGWALNPEPLARPHLATGRLVDLSPAHPPEVALNWQVTRLAAGPLEPLTRAVMAAARGALVSGGRAANRPERTEGTQIAIAAAARAMPF